MIKDEQQMSIFVGGKLKHFRYMNFMTARDVGEILGVTPQQISKYEDGTNRISAIYLWEIAQVLKIDICKFFCRSIEDVNPKGQRIIDLLHNTRCQKYIDIFIEVLEAIAE